MKRFFLISSLMLLAVIASADPAWVSYEASGFTLVGKAFDTPNPYHRVDTVRYKGFDKAENFMCRVPAGLAVLFRTDAKTIGVCVKMKQCSPASYRSYRGFDLYIKKDGKWVWAGMNDFPVNHKDPLKVAKVVENMAAGEKECLMYLPLFAELESCNICIPKGSRIEALESPFRHKIVFHGSSFTHGISTSRAGMSYPSQFMRRTGMQIIPLGFSGHCKMQPYFLELLKDVEADAYVFDPFSNSNARTINERLETFIDGMVKAHPGKPIIMQRTIYWEKENFNTAVHKDKQGRRDLTDSLMPILCKRYKDVYYIKPDASLHSEDSSTADGTHPDNYGYTLWERSIEKPILKILAKYGIR